MLVLLDSLVDSLYDLVQLHVATNGLQVAHAIDEALKVLCAVEKDGCRDEGPEVNFRSTRTRPLRQGPLFILRFIPVDLPGLPGPTLEKRLIQGAGQRTLSHLAARSVEVHPRPVSRKLDALGRDHHVADHLSLLWGTLKRWINAITKADGHDKTNGGHVWENLDESLLRFVVSLVRLTQRHLVDPKFAHK